MKASTKLRGNKDLVLGGKSLIELNSNFQILLLSKIEYASFAPGFSLSSTQEKNKPSTKKGARLPTIMSKHSK